MVKEQLVVRGRTIEYEIIPSKRAKRINLTVSKEKVKVSLPLGVPIEEARKFVVRKKDWIWQKIEIMQKNQLPKKQFREGESFLYRGQLYTLKIKTTDSKKPDLLLKDSNLWLLLPNHWPKNSEVIRDVLIWWYKEQGRKLLGQRLEYYTRLLGVQYTELRIKEQKTRWGSCSNKGNINLNWRIILAPDQVIDYVVLHEAAHLKQMNHSVSFWLLVAGLMPDYSEWKQWLKERGKELFF